MLLRSVITNLGAFALCGRLPSRRAIAALAKLCGRRPTRAWPFLSAVEEEKLNLYFDDLLELQYAKSRYFVALVIGAFDGLTNDPTSRFILSHQCTAILV